MQDVRERNARRARQDERQHDLHDAVRKLEQCRKHRGGPWLGHPRVRLGKKPRNIDMKGWVKDWSQKEVTGMTDDQEQKLKKQPRNMSKENYDQSAGHNRWKGTNDSDLEGLAKYLTEQDYKVRGESVRCVLELISLTKPMEKAQAMFCQAMEDAGGGFSLAGAPSRSRCTHKLSQRKDPKLPPNASWYVKVTLTRDGRL